MNWYKINTSRHNYKIYIGNLIKYNFEDGIGDQHLRVTLFFLNDIRLDRFRCLMELCSVFGPFLISALARLERYWTILDKILGTLGSQDGNAKEDID